MGLNTSIKTGLIFMGLLLLISCSTKKNAWLNRNFHAMGTYYNTLYNGKLALEKGKQSLVQDYKDNYWEILPVERMQVDDDAAFNREESRNGNFVLAEEKATKAIQKHSMLIDGTQYNPQMDEAFLLLGKARYFDQRFVPALDAFNYILDRQQDSSTVVPAVIWKAKTQLRMNYPKAALQHLKELLQENSEIDREEMIGVSTTMAQAYLDLGHKDSALIGISRAAEMTKNDEERGRYLFIKAQLYDVMSMTDSADAIFDHIIALKRKTPRVYRIHAFMEKAKNFDFDQSDRVAMLEMLNELVENRENRPFLDNIYYQLAEYYYSIDSTKIAVAYYNKSLREDSRDVYLDSRNYLVLGNINFDHAQYKKAGAYYDSTLTNLSDNTREFRKLKKKRDNLDEVILYEDIAVKNDSILNLAAMSETEQLVFFTKYTQEKKDQAMEKAVAAMEVAHNVSQNTGVGGFFQRKNGQENLGNKDAVGFYFYDASQVAFGKLSFQKIWGDRPLQDHWRNNASGAKREEGPEQEAPKLTKERILAGLNNDPQYDPATYISKIPTEEKVIDSLITDRDFAYYQLGMIYKEKFQEYELAIDKLEALLMKQPEERLVLPAKYNLYKIYSITGRTAKANEWKQNILQNHPDSRYAAIILNPTEYKAGENSPEAIYKRVYEKYLAQEFQTVIDSSNTYIAQFTGDPIVPKFELLKATAIGRLRGFEEYKKALNFVALNYPLSDEGKRAQELYSVTIPALADKEFKENTPKDKYHLIYIFPKTEKGIAHVLQEKINKSIEDMSFSTLSTSIDVYNNKELFLAIHGFTTDFTAKEFNKKLQNADFDLEKQFFRVSSSNYKIILIHKNLNKYLQSEIN